MQKRTNKTLLQQVGHKILKVYVLVNIPVISNDIQGVSGGIVNILVVVVWTIPS